MYSQFYKSLYTCYLLVCVIINFYSSRSYADISRLRIAGLTGFAQSHIIGANNKKQDNQGPMGVSGHVDYLLSGQWEIGAEHLRTLSVRNGSAVGLTGLSVKNYFWFSHPQTQFADKEMHSQAIFKAQAFAPYIGLSCGIAQASVLDRNIGSLGGYAAFKAGTEYPINDDWGLRAESTFATSVFGTGTVNYLAVLFGAYFYL